MVVELKGLLNQFSLIGKPFFDSSKTFKLLESLRREYEAICLNCKFLSLVRLSHNCRPLNHDKCYTKCVTPTVNENMSLIAQRSTRGGCSGPQRRGDVTQLSSQGRRFNPSVFGNQN